MVIVETNRLSIKQKGLIKNLWNTEYPAQLQFATLKELDQYLVNLQNRSHILVFDDTKKLIGWVFTFQRDNEDWFAIIVARQMQNRRLGTFLLQMLKDKHQSLHGWVIDHNNYKKQDEEPYISPLEFYLKNGFNSIADIRLESDKLSAVKILWKR